MLYSTVVLHILSTCSAPHDVLQICGPVCVLQSAESLLCCVVAVQLEGEVVAEQHTEWWFTMLDLDGQLACMRVRISTQDDYTPHGVLRSNEIESTGQTICGCGNGKGGYNTGYGFNMDFDPQPNWHCGWSYAKHLPSSYSGESAAATSG